MENSWQITKDFNIEITGKWVIENFGVSKCKDLSVCDFVIHGMGGGDVQTHYILKIVDDGLKVRGAMDYNDRIFGKSWPTVQYDFYDLFKLEEVIAKDKKIKNSKREPESVAGSKLDHGSKSLI